MKRIGFEGGGAATPPLSDIEIARIWRSLSAAIPHAPVHGRRRVPWAALTLAAACAAGAFLGARWYLERSPDPELVTRAADSPRELLLGDGSRLALGPSGAVRLLEGVPGETRVALLRGHLEVTVPADGATTTSALMGRRLRLVVGRHELLLRAARTRTDAQLTLAESSEDRARRLEVTLQAGRAELLPPEGAPLRLAPGESWSGHVD
jgi:ferric-dicitrate binding protein FerR (iron transport regulator)